MKRGKKEGVTQSKKTWYCRVCPKYLKVGVPGLKQFSPLTLDRVHLGQLKQYDDESMTNQHN